MYIDSEMVRELTDESLGVTVDAFIDWECEQKNMEAVALLSDNELLAQCLKEDWDVFREHLEAAADAQRDRFFGIA